MSIIGSLAAQAFFDSKKIIKGQMTLLESELSDMGLAMPSVMVLKVGEEVSAGEAAKESMKLFGGNLRVDHVVQAGIETPEGPIAMIQQYSRANAFPAEFRMKLPYPAPAAVSLHKGILSKSFEPHEAQEDDPVAKAFCEALDDLHCWIELEWSQDLPGNMKMDVPWGCQVIPSGEDHCILLVQTARIGFLTEVLGVKATTQIRDDVSALLRDWTGGTTDNLGPVDYAASLTNMDMGVPLAEFMAEPKEDAAPAQDNAPGELVQKGEEPSGPVASKAPIPSIAAAAISLFLPGVGQMISGQIAKGAVILVVTILMCGLGGIINVVAAIDAYLIAQKQEKGQTVGDWDFF